MTGFSFSSEFDGEQYSSLSRLVKFNNGLFKSEKQSSFLLKRVLNVVSHEHSIECKKHFGVDVAPGQHSLMVHGDMRWVEYGSRSVIPISWCFVADEYGIVRQYKIKYRGNLRDGAYPDPTRVELLWERSADTEKEIAAKIAAAPAAQESTPEKPASMHIGIIGKRQLITAKVIAIRQFETANRFHYYDSGVRNQTILDVDGNVVVYWNLIGDAEVGNTVVFSGMIKDHTEYKGVKQTVVSRATKVIVM